MVYMQTAILISTTHVNTQWRHLAIPTHVLEYLCDIRYCIKYNGARVHGLNIWPQAAVTPTHGALMNTHAVYNMLNNVAIDDDVEALSSSPVLYTLRLCRRRALCGFFFLFFSGLAQFRRFDSVYIVLQYYICSLWYNAPELYRNEMRGFVCHRVFRLDSAQHRLCDDLNDVPRVEHHSPQSTIDTSFAIRYVHVRVSILRDPPVIGLWPTSKRATSERATLNIIVEEQFSQWMIFSLAHVLYFIFDPLDTRCRTFGA